MTQHLQMGPCACSSSLWKVRAQGAELATYTLQVEHLFSFKLIVLFELEWQELELKQLLCCGWQGSGSTGWNSCRTSHIAAHRTTASKASSSAGAAERNSPQMEGEEEVLLLLR